jgi:MerR family mercuric resistance operon transcriptional regulator
MVSRSAWPHRGHVNVDSTTIVSMSRATSEPVALKCSLESVPRYGVKGRDVTSELSIGRLAAEAGVNVETIRYYQRRGLLAQPHKPQSGQRRYPTELTKRVRFIKRAQVLGFTLEEIAGLLRLEEACACAETRELAQRKLQIIEGKLADLKAMRKALAGLVRQCDVPASKSCCPIIHALTVD